MTNAPSIRPQGRPCTVCALPARERGELELALADGATFLSVARSTMGAVDRNAVRRHVVNGHLPERIAESVERLAGLDAASLQQRIYEIAQRARETAQEAYAAGHHSTVLRAGDAEARALGVLAQLGVKHEEDVERATAYRSVTRAVLIAARTHPEVGEAVAAVLDQADQQQHAAEIRAQFHESKGLTA